MLDTRFAQHIASLYMMGQEGLNETDLIVRFWEDGDDSLLSSLVLFISNELRQSQDAGNVDELWTQCRLYWQSRIDILARIEADTEQCGQECLTFLLWLEHIPVNIDEIADLLEPTLRLATPDGFRWRTLLEYLVSQVEHDAVLVGYMLLIVVQRLERLAGTELAHVRRVLESLLVSKQEEARKYAEEAISFLGECCGFYSLRGLLE
jgi:hypothetical protein